MIYRALGWLVGLVLAMALSVGVAFWLPWLGAAAHFFIGMGLGATLTMIGGELGASFGETREWRRHLDNYDRRPKS